MRWPLHALFVAICSCDCCCYQQFYTLGIICIYRKIWCVFIICPYPSVSLSLHHSFLALSLSFHSPELFLWQRITEKFILQKTPWIQRWKFLINVFFFCSFRIYDSVVSFGQFETWYGTKGLLSRAVAAATATTVQIFKKQLKIVCRMYQDTHRQTHSVGTLIVGKESQGDAC